MITNAAHVAAHVLASASPSAAVSWALFAARSARHGTCATPAPRCSPSPPVLPRSPPRRSLSPPSAPQSRQYSAAFHGRRLRSGGGFACTAFFPGRSRNVIDSTRAYGLPSNARRKTSRYVRKAISRAASWHIPVVSRGQQRRRSPSPTHPYNGAPPRRKPGTS